MLPSYHPYQVGSLCHVVGEALSVQSLLSATFLSFRVHLLQLLERSPFPNLH